jgi:hypothetical protein
LIVPSDPFDLRYLPNDFFETGAGDPTTENEFSNIVVFPVQVPIPFIDHVVGSQIEYPKPGRVVNELGDV